MLSNTYKPDIKSIVGTSPKLKAKFFLFPSRDLGKVMFYPGKYKVSIFRLNKGPDANMTYTPTTVVSFLYAKI